MGAHVVSFSIWYLFRTLRLLLSAITITDAIKVAIVVCSSIIYQFLADTKADDMLFLLLHRSVTLEALTARLSLCAVYCVVAKDSVGKQISIAFLERMKVDFKKRYGGGKAGTSMAKSLNKEFGFVHPSSWWIGNLLISLHKYIYSYFVETKHYNSQAGSEGTHELYHWTRWRNWEAIKGEGSSFRS